MFGYLDSYTSLLRNRRWLKHSQFKLIGLEVGVLQWQKQNPFMKSCSPLQEDRNCFGEWVCNMDRELQLWMIVVVSG